MARIIPEGSVHLRDDLISLKTEGLFHIVPFELLRKTPSVDFHSVPFSPSFNGMDRVIHQQGAVSPGAVGEVARPWYMHPWQEDNLITLHGRRIVELYHPTHGKIETFEMHPDHIKWNGEIVLEGPGILGWPIGVFHRNSSPFEGGSVSCNLAVRFENFNVDTEFNIYDLDLEKNEAKMIRLGALDQPGKKS